jgi:hypothetical protein
MAKFFIGHFAFYTEGYKAKKRTLFQERAFDKNKNIS